MLYVDLLHCVNQSSKHLTWPSPAGLIGRTPELQRLHVNGQRSYKPANLGCMLRGCQNDGPLGQSYTLEELLII